MLLLIDWLYVPRINYFANSKRSIYQSFSEPTMIFDAVKLALFGLARLTLRLLLIVLRRVTGLQSKWQHNASSSVPHSVSKASTNVCVEVRCSLCAFECQLVEMNSRLQGRPARPILTCFNCTACQSMPIHALRCMIPRIASHC